MHPMPCFICMGGLRRGALNGGRMDLCGAVSSVIRIPHLYVLQILTKPHERSRSIARCADRISRARRFRQSSRPPVCGVSTSYIDHAAPRDRASWADPC